MIARLLVVLAVLPAAVGGLRRNRLAAGPVPDRAPGAAISARVPRGSGPPRDSGGDQVPRASGAVRTARRVLVAAGVLLLGVALGSLVAGVPLGQWTAIGVWLVVALVLHDALLAPLLIVGARLLRRGSDRLPWRALAAVQVVVAVGFAVTLVAFPAIRAQQLGARNPSVLIFDYPLHLAVAWAVAGALVALAITWGAVRGRPGRAVRA